MAELGLDAQSRGVVRFRMANVNGYRTTRHFGFVYPSESLLNSGRILDVHDFRVALPASLLKSFATIERYSSVPDLVARAVLVAVTEPGGRHDPFPRMEFAISPNQRVRLISRLAAEGIEPYLSKLAPPWLPGGKNELDDRKYGILRDAILKNEATYAELASRYLVRLDTRSLAEATIEAASHPFTKGRYQSAESYYLYNKHIADVIEEYLPDLCTAWRYAEANVVYHTSATDWKALQAQYGLFP